MAEIVRAARSAEWVEVESRFRTSRPPFPMIPNCRLWKKNWPEPARMSSRRSLDQLDAAQAVSDADRVFEIYQSMSPSLDRGLAVPPLIPRSGRWFLGLIHRRLRTGNVQADVVQLAAAFRRQLR